MFPNNAKAPKGFVVFDYDGTLIDKSELIFAPTQKTKETLRKLQQNGFVIGLATGRSFCYIPKEELEFDFYITANGANISCNETIFFNEVFEGHMLQEMVDYLKQREFSFVVETREKCFVYGHENERYRNMVKRFELDTTSFLAYDDFVEKANKLMVIYDNIQQYERFKDRFSDVVYITAPHLDVLSNDVSPKGINKGNALRLLGQAFGVAMKDTYAFGDGGNDYEMLQQSGHGIAMGAHNKKLEEVCEFVTDTVKNEGIYKACQRLNLI